MTAPAPQKYEVSDINGETYVWSGVDPSTVPFGVFTWGDGRTGTDIVWLHCDDHSFVNSSQVVSLKPISDDDAQQTQQ
ncbi:hypothetical protein FB384_004959 [Prauserella sediminis]|uniref:Uncharacterized protein n=1 Tax=Prauserella sediminis TaxID=577680 RepID=A0A839XS40_9PSEU|nr:hypothetical protein [Prauserella sediminis]MBB3666000.1 hypothetical protein [Prauserella sediminis]